MASAWHMSAFSDLSTGTSPTDAILAKYAALVTANASDPNFYWEVAASSTTSPQYVLFRRKNGNPGRIIMFGQQGSVPNAGAAYVTTSGALYLGYSPTSTANTPDASWLTAAPLSATDYIKGCNGPNPASMTAYRVGYFDSPDRLVFHGSNQTVSPLGIGWMQAGLIYVDRTGAAVHGVASTGTSLSSSYPSGTGAGNGYPNTPTANATYSVSTGTMIMQIGSANVQVFRASAWTASGVMINAATNIGQFYPIAVCGPTDLLQYGIVGSMSQIAYGPPCMRETTWTDTSGNVIGFGASYQSTAASPVALWLLNQDV